MVKEKWHRGSRYWIIGPYIVVLSAVLSMWFDDATAFISIAAPFIAGAGATNAAERFKPGVPHPNQTVSPPHARPE